MLTRLGKENKCTYENRERGLLMNKGKYLLDHWLFFEEHLQDVCYLQYKQQSKHLQQTLEND